MFAPEPSIENQVQDVQKVDKAQVEKLGESSENVVGDEIASKPSEEKAQMEDPNPKEESMQVNSPKYIHIPTMATIMQPCFSFCPNFSSTGTLDWKTTPALLDGHITLKTWLTQTRHRWSNTKWETDAFKEEAHLQSVKNWNPSRPTGQVTEVIRGLIRAVIKFHSEEKRPHGYLFNLENILLGDSKVKHFPNAAMKVRKIVLCHHNMEEKQEDMHEWSPVRKAMYDEKSINHDMEVLARNLIIRSSSANPHILIGVIGVGLELEVIR
ncbi:hypothetical protein Tsubulata_035723 [Turnera subulata]|uniref:Uncharacterized protein n=1 Tax=Turnera subulata TaxID=218843 RepID=A0A9Q0JMV5_9ROSI|nr:hypothetical protein Tsubulata_035723 [Turnera subulata]